MRMSTHKHSITLDINMISVIFTIGLFCLAATVVRLNNSINRKKQEIKEEKEKNEKIYNFMKEQREERKEKIQKQKDMKEQREIQDRKEKRQQRKQEKKEQGDKDDAARVIIYNENEKWFVGNNLSSDLKNFLDMLSQGLSTIYTCSCEADEMAATSDSSADPDQLFIKHTLLSKAEMMCGPDRYVLDTQKFSNMLEMASDGTILSMLTMIEDIDFSLRYIVDENSLRVEDFPNETQKGFLLWVLESDDPTFVKLFKKASILQNKKSL